MPRPVRRPARPLDALVTALPVGTRLWRSHPLTGNVTFFPVSARPTRFGPVRRPDGSIVGLWYGATDEEGAIFESVFHDVPIGAASPRVLFNEFASRMLSPVRTARELVLVDFTSAGLRRLRVSRSALIETTSHQYAHTAVYGQVSFEDLPTADGLLWVSRLHDTSRALALFGDRAESSLEPDETIVPRALGAGAGLELVERLADRVKVTIVYP